MVRITDVKNENGFLKWTYILLTALSCLSIFRSAEWTKLKLAHVLFIAIAMLHFALFFKTKHIKTLWKFLWRYGFLLIVILDLSFFINIARGSETALIKLGTVKIVYQFITVFVGLSAVYLFEDKAVDYTFWGYVLFNSVSILLAFKECGLSEAIVSINEFITTGGEAHGFMKYLELHDGTFAFGIFLLYYFIQGIKEHKKEFLVGTFFFAIGYKRIGIGGLFLAMIVASVLKKVRWSTAKTLGKLTLLTFFIAGIVCVVTIRSGLFEYVMHSLSIDMHSRENLFAYIKDFYDISPRFIGHGFESIRSILASAGDIKVNNTYISRMAAIHSDYLRMYIELGFWGFLFWEWYLFLFMPAQMSRIGRLTFISYVACTVYLATTYFTDNTAMFFLTSVAYKLIPVQFAVIESEVSSDG